MTTTFKAAVPVWFLAVAAACLWTPAPTWRAGVLLLGVALLVPPGVLLASAAVSALHSARLARLDHG
jgi:hypothetical protein